MDIFGLPMKFGPIRSDQCRIFANLFMLDRGSSRLSATMCCGGVFCARPKNDDILLRCSGSGKLHWAGATLGGHEARNGHQD